MGLSFWLLIELTYPVHTYCLFFPLPVFRDVHLLSVLYILY
jgi:hypothetical protein